MFNPHLLAQTAREHQQFQAKIAQVPRSSQLVHHTIGKRQLTQSSECCNSRNSSHGSIDIVSSSRAACLCGSDDPACRVGRALRLRKNSSPAQPAAKAKFLPELVGERGRLRLLEFLKSKQQMSVALRHRLEKMNERLKPLGYNIMRWEHVQYTHAKAQNNQQMESERSNNPHAVQRDSLFAPWEFTI